MFMPDNEIIFSFKQAKYPSRQVGILAELNGVSVKEMRVKLRELGFDVKDPAPRLRSNGEVLKEIDGDRLWELFLSGKNDSEIAAQLGTVAWRVMEYRRSNGLLRPRGGARSGRRKKEAPSLLQPPVPPETEGSRFASGEPVSVSVLADILDTVRKVYPCAELRVDGVPVCGLSFSVRSDRSDAEGRAWVSLSVKEAAT